MKQFTYTITESVGIHARPASILVKQAGSYPCSVTIDKNGKKADVKKLMALMALGVKYGEEVTFSLEGEQEEEAAKSLEEFCRQNL